MSFVEDMYKPKPNPYTGEKMLVHNLFLEGVLKHAAEKNMNVRHFEGFFYTYNREPGDGSTSTSEINPQKYTPIDIYTSYTEIDWNVVKKLIYELVKEADIGFRTFEVQIYEKNEERQEREKYVSPILHRPRYRTYSVKVHCLWVKSAW